MNAATVQSVSNLIAFLAPSFPEELEGPRHVNMAALLADACLQSAINYRRVVHPRCVRIAQEFPECLTIQSIGELLGRGIRPEDLLNWRGREKISRFLSLYALLNARKVTDVQSLAAYLRGAKAQADILALRGFGEKTLDYLRVLCGLDAMPIDRHIMRFLEIAGVSTSRMSYYDAQRLVSKSCSIAGLRGSRVDQGLWYLMQACY